ncbi:family 16 glycosylhydrolase [Maribacter sp. 2210JD10-5]|uniref:family 16 glycosylhydrolase n=1 Tax=Maribacter sp. 2210JD10-5 TaxID=3386272 RepID=UPI0039BD4299
MKLIFLLLLSILTTSPNLDKKDPPEPEIGKRWVLNLQYSDEFNGNSLDAMKWKNSYDGWKGRTPGFFSPESVSVHSGMLQIKNGVLDKSITNHTKEKYSIKGGAVQSLEKSAHFGYYEARFKASRINMSTTFWMSNKKVPVDFTTKISNGNCEKDQFSQELDIAESIGGEITVGDKFRKNMNFNTHYRYIDCEGGKEKFYSAGNNAVEGNGLASNATLSTESWQDFHTYAAHWKNANEVSFYADDKLVGDVQIRTDVVDEPFPRPMGINMVTETYNWAKPYPNNEELENDEINTSYYNWVRAYTLVDIDTETKNPKNFKGEGSEIYKEEIRLFETPTISKGEISIPYVYKANTNKSFLFKVMEGDEVAYETEIQILAGYGKAIKNVKAKKLKKNTDYTFTTTFVK